MKIRLLHTYGVIGAVFLCSCQKPLAVVHCLRPDIHYAKKKGYGMPIHHFYSRLFCFDELCRKKSAWIRKQKHVAVKVRIKNKFRKNDPQQPKPEPIPMERTGIRFD